MSITHHPSDQTLASFTNGTLDEARMLVVSTHLVACAQCRRAARAFERLSGDALAGITPVPMRPDAMRNVIERAAAPAAAVSDLDASRNPTILAQASPLSLYRLGPWRWAGRGVAWRPVPVAPGPGEPRALMLRAAPGTRIPHHRHSGTEWTCVLEGALSHAQGRFGVGDFDEADETVEHRPIIEAGPPCVCLVALSGRIALSGWIGRLLQPLVRF